MNGQTEIILCCIRGSEFKEEFISEWGMLAKIA